MAAKTTVKATPLKRRNVVVIGKTGGGKSSVANKILGDAADNNFETGRAFTSCTTEVAARSAVLETDDGTMYVVKVIDTIGLFDTTSQDLAKSNTAAMQAIKKFFLEESPEGVNLILFVCRQGHWTAEEQKTFDYILRYFREDISALSALVFTQCDNLSLSGRERILEEFKHDPKRAVIADFMKKGKGMHTVGFPDLNDMPSALRSVYEDLVGSDQKMLRNLVYGCEKRYLSEQLLRQSFWEKCVIL